MSDPIVVHHIPGKAPSERLLVSFRQTGNTNDIALHQQHWAEGIGWYDQKVMHFDSQQWAAFQSISGVKTSEFQQIDLTPTVSIPFPGPSETGKQQQLRLEHA